MNILLIRDISQLISQYCPKVYCTLRLLNHEVKANVDAVLPVLQLRGKNSTKKERKMRGRFLKKCNNCCGFTLLDGSSFDLWLRAMRKVFDRMNDHHGEIVEKFCWDYLPKKSQIVGQNALGILCTFNRGCLVKKLWNEKILESTCIREIAKMNDLEFFSLVHSSMNEISNDIIKQCIRNASKFHRWNITKYLWHHYSSDNAARKVFLDFFLDAVGNELVEDMDPGLLKDQDAMTEAVSQRFNVFDYADESFRKNKTYLLEAIKCHSSAFRNADEEMKKDREFVLAAVKLRGFAVRYADESLKKDREIVLAAVRNDGYALQFVDQTLRKDKEIVLEAMNEQYRALGCSDISLRKDRDFILAAVQQHGDALQFADESLKKDREIVLAAVRNEGFALQYAKEFCNDKEIVHAAFSQDEEALYLADESLQNDQDFLKTLQLQYND